MHVIILSRDQSLFVESSPFRARAMQYAKLFKTLTVVVPRSNIGSVFTEGNLTGVSVRGFVSLYCAGARALKKVRKETAVLTAQEELTSIVAWLLSIRFGIPWQYQIHTDLFGEYFAQHSIKNRIRAYLGRFLVTRASGVRVVSIRIKESIERIFTVQRPITVLPIAVAIREYPIRSYEDPKEDFVFLMVSRLTSEKNIPLAIRAFGRVHSEYPRTLLRIVGDGPLKAKIEKIVMDYKLGTAVQFEGWVQDPSRFYTSDHCFLSTSWYEGYGMSIVEAMARGLPVITTDVGVAGELLQDEMSGIIVEPGDEGEVVHALSRVLTDYGLRWRIGMGAQTTVRTLPKEDVYVRSFKESLEVCL